MGGSGGTQILAVTPTVDEGSGEDEGTRGWGRGATEVLDGASPAPTALMPTATPEPSTRWATPSSPASPQVRVVPNPVGKTPAALNAAIAASRHDILVRVDGHGELGPDYLTTAVRTLGIR